MSTIALLNFTHNYATIMGVVKLTEVAEENFRKKVQLFTLMALPDFSKIFHQSSKDRAKGRPTIPPDAKDWPEEWKTTYYKAYPRLPKIELDDESPQVDFLI